MRWYLSGIMVAAALVGSAAHAHENVAGKPESPAAPSFRNDVLAVFAKAGCNSGACHGALAGKGGFKLSLRGYDAAADYFAIAREARGRRIELADPARSLILAKPTGAIPHKGGVRFEVGSPEYEVISQWIAHGAPPPRDDDPSIDKVVVTPGEAALGSGDKLQLAVHAHYSDGRAKEVTRWARFESTDKAVVDVNDQGQVTVMGHGGGAVTAWFASKIAIARVTVPYENRLPDDAFAEFEPRSFIDEHVARQLKKLNLPPSAPVDDATFLRRTMLDTIGTLPSADEVRAFLADDSPGKRERLIESLLERPEFVDYWTYKWSDVLLVNGGLLRPPAVEAYYQWIRRHVEENTPWDEFARLVVTARGSSVKNGATNFYALHQDAETMTENICQAFLGLSIGCAKCHNHPLEKWTNDQYYAMASLFARVRAKGWGGDASKGDGVRTLFVADSGELVQPSTGRPQPPTPLDGEPLSFAFEGDRRQAVAQWMTAPDNPYFARAIANRVWANFFGRGLVEAVDDMRESNPASNEPLMAALAEFLIEHDYDLKQLMREILRSTTYQRSSVPLPENAAETRFFSRYYPRRMMAEVLLDAITQVTHVPTLYTHIDLRGAQSAETDFYEPGTRALELYDSAVESYFLTVFGRNPRNITCECERSDEPSMIQVLHISNGDTINEKLRDEKSVVSTVLASDMPAYRIIENAYLATLSRYPTDHEMQQLLPLLSASETSEKRNVVEDLYWSILSSREFLFTH